MRRLSDVVHQPVMARRSTSQFRIDDRAFPIRVKFVVPAGGMQGLDIAPQGWLRENLGTLAWAWGPADVLAGQGTAYYFRRIEDAQRFVAAFPGLELADGVDSPVYRSPATGVGPERLVDTAWHSAGPGPGGK